MMAVPGSKRDIFHTGPSYPVTKYACRAPPGARSTNCGVLTGPGQTTCQGRMYQPLPTPVTRMFSPCSNTPQYHARDHIHRQGHWLDPLSQRSHPATHAPKSANNTLSSQQLTCMGVTAPGSASQPLQGVPPAPTPLTTPSSRGGSWSSALPGTFTPTCPYDFSSHLGPQRTFQPLATQQNVSWSQKNPTPYRQQIEATEQQAFTEDLALLGSSVDSLLGMSLSDSAIEVLPPHGQCDAHNKFHGSLSSCELRSPCMPVLLNPRSQPLSYVPPKRPETLSEAAAMYIDYLIHENENMVLISKCNTFRSTEEFDKEGFLKEVLPGPCQMPSENFRAWLKQFNVDVEVVSGDGPLPSSQSPHQYVPVTGAGQSSNTPISVTEFGALNPTSYHNQTPVGQDGDALGHQGEPSFSFIDEKGNEVIIKQSQSSTSLPSNIPQEGTASQDLFLNNVIQDPNSIEFLLPHPRVQNPNRNSTVNMPPLASPSTFSYGPRQAIASSSTVGNFIQVESPTSGVLAGNKTGYSESLCDLFAYRPQLSAGTRRKNSKTYHQYSKPDNFIMVPGSEVYPHQAVSADSIATNNTQGLHGNGCYHHDNANSQVMGPKEPEQMAQVKTTGPAVDGVQYRQQKMQQQMQMQQMQQPQACFLGYQPVPIPDLGQSVNEYVDQCSTSDQTKVDTCWNQVVSRPLKSGGHCAIPNLTVPQSDIQPRQQLQPGQLFEQQQQLEPELTVKQQQQLEPELMVQQQQQLEPELMVEQQQQLEPELMVEQQQQLEPELMVEQQQQLGPELMVKQQQQLEPELMVEQQQQLEPELMVEQQQQLEPELMVEQQQQLEPELMVEQQQQLEPELMVEQQQQLEPELMVEQQQQLEPELMVEQQQQLEPELMVEQQQQQLELMVKQQHQLEPELMVEQQQQMEPELTVEQQMEPELMVEQQMEPELEIEQQQQLPVMSQLQPNSQLEQQQHRECVTKPGTMQELKQHLLQPQPHQPQQSPHDPALDPDLRPLEQGVGQQIEAPNVISDPDRVMDGTTEGRQDIEPGDSWGSPAPLTVISAPDPGTTGVKSTTPTPVAAAVPPGLETTTDYGPEAPSTGECRNNGVEEEDGLLEMSSPSSALESSLVIVQ